MTLYRRAACLVKAMTRCGQGTGRCNASLIHRDSSLIHRDSSFERRDPWLNIRQPHAHYLPHAHYFQQPNLSLQAHLVYLEAKVKLHESVATISSIICMKERPPHGVSLTSLRTSPACIKPDLNASPSLNTIETVGPASRGSNWMP